MLKRIFALALVFAVLLTAACAEEPKLSPRAQAIRLAEEALRETYGLTQPMYCYFAREMKEEDGAWTLTYSGLEVFGYVLGQYTVRVADGKAECAWSWDGVEARSFGGAPWGSAQLKELCDYVRNYSTYAAYYQMAEALKRSARVTAEDVDDWGYLPMSDGKLIDAVDLPLGLDGMLDIGKRAVVTLWGLTEEQSERLSGTELEPDFMQIDGVDCLVIYYHFGTNEGDTDAMENVHPEWMELAGVYAVALSAEDGAVMDLRYDSDLRGNG